MNKGFNVYVIENKFNGKLYIGQTVRTVEKRWKIHIKDSRKFNYVFYNAIKNMALRPFSLNQQYQ